jgi:ABC-type sugar transport system substrate-binding protein
MKKGCRFCFLIIVVGLFAVCSNKEGSAAKIEATDTSTVQAGAIASVPNAPNDYETVRIGFIGWGYSDRLAISYRRYLDYVAPYVNMKIEYGQFSTAEEIISSAESLIQKGVHGIMTTIASGALMDLCERNNVYMAQWGSPVLDKELKAYLEKSPYWIGCSTVDDYASGKAMVQYLYNIGSRNVGLMAPAAGNACHDDRFRGVFDQAKEYSDFKVVGEFRDAILRTTAPNALQNMIAAYPKLDGIITTGASDGTLEAIIQTLDTEGKTDKIKYATIDIQDGIDTYMEEGALHFIEGGQFPEVVFLALCIVNAYDKKLDLPIQLDSHLINIEGQEGYNDYIKYIDDGELLFPFSGEELQKFVNRCNPNATFDDMYRAWNTYSLPSVKARKG